MNYLFLALFLAVPGSVFSGFYSTCDSRFQKCTAMFPQDQIEGTEWFPPTPELLKTLCSPAVMVIECTTESVKECTGMNMDELAALDNETISTPAKFFLDMGKLVIDLCEEGSTLHEGYVNNVECFREMVEKTVETCRLEALAIYKGYKESLELLGDEEDADTFDSEKECLLASYVMACISLELQQSCGEEARVTFLEILRRIRHLKMGVCSGQDVVNLKKQFMDYVEYEGEKKDLFAVAFELRRRKK